MELVFRDTQSAGYPNDLSGHAIVHLKIFYYKIPGSPLQFFGECLHYFCPHQREMLEAEASALKAKRFVPDLEVHILLYLGM